MKRFFLFAGLFIALQTTTLTAQVSKFGHINSADLIQDMPQTKQADSTLKKFGESLEGQLKIMTGEYQNKIQDFQMKRDSMPDAIKTIKQQELQDLGNRIEDFRQTAQESIQKKKEELYGPILKRAEDAIKEVAKEKGFAYIFDTSSGAFLYATESEDIESLVRAKLGMK